MNLQSPCDEKSALHIAAENGRLECVKTLIEAGTHLDSTDHQHDMPLHLAEANNHLDCALFIEQAIARNYVSVPAYRCILL